jgi:hypothetical protein
MENGENPTAGGKSGDSTAIPAVNLAGIKRGRGRPPGSGKKTPDAAQPGKGSENASLADAEFLADAVVAIVETGDEVLQNALMRKLSAAIPAKAGEFAELQDEIRLGAKDKDLIRKCVVRIAQKYALVTKFAPEILLLGVLAQYGLRQARLVRFVENAIVTAQKTPRPANPAAN